MKSVFNLAIRAIWVWMFCLTLVYADTDSLMCKPDPNEASPSKDQVLWTSTELAYDFNLESSYVGTVSTSFGDGREGNMSSSYFDAQQTVTGRKWMAFLWHAGVEVEHYDFSAPSMLPIPSSLTGLSLPLALDFRWSEHHLMRVQAAPGFYAEGYTFDGPDVNVPMSVGYSWIPSRAFQMGLGLSYNGLRQSHFLGGGGFRWQINDRWKLKFLLPQPQVEYKAAPALHLWAGTDFRGETFRTSSHFGTDRGTPSLDRALVDYQEIRAGGGFSWNIKPLLEFNAEGGFLLDRTINYHNNDLRSTSGKVPYFSINLRYLFQIKKDDRSLAEQVKELEDEQPWLRRYSRSSATGVSQY